MSLIERIAAARGKDESRFAIDQWLTDYLLPANQFGYNNNTYPLGLNTTMGVGRIKEISGTLPAYSAALRSCPPAFAAEMVRALVLSQANFIFRNNRRSRTPGRTFGTGELGLLERPWPGATTGELLSRMEWHAGLAGNAYVARQPGRLRVLRPDWVVILFGSDQEPDDAAHALDGELIGYVYMNGGFQQNQNQPHTLLPNEVAHWSPLPDPERAHVGMSWITPAIRDIQGDGAATDHKLKFWANGATPNLVVSGLPASSREQFEELVDSMETRHAGLRNAYRTLYLTLGADAKVVGSDMKQMDFKSVQGAGETRIAFLSRVPAPILGIAEGLAGSSLNAGNFGMARRIFADSWVYPTLQDLAASLSPIINVPGDADLWYDVADMPLLREDAKDAAEIENLKAATITNLVKEGFTPESAIAAVMGQNMQLLKHTGLVSVQLWPPGTQAQPLHTGPNPDPPVLPDNSPKPVPKPAVPKPPPKKT